MAKLDGVFWQGRLGFVVDRGWAESHIADGRAIERIDIGPLLEFSGRLPDLGLAPVASWLVARLFQSTGNRLGFEPHARLRNDGGGVPIHLIAFTESLKPVAFLFLRGESSGIELWGECAAEVSLDQITSAFASALIENPDHLMRCKLTTIDADPLNLPGRRYGTPHVFGWDGRKFLGRRIDEESIVAQAAAAADGSPSDQTSSREPKRLRLIGVSLSWPHDPWCEPAGEP